MTVTRDFTDPWGCKGYVVVPTKGTKVRLPVGIQTLITHPGSIFDAWRGGAVTATAAPTWARSEATVEGHGATRRPYGAAAGFNAPPRWPDDG